MSKLKERDIEIRRLVKEILAESKRLSGILGKREVFLVCERYDRERRERVKLDYWMKRNAVSGSARRFG